MKNKYEARLGTERMLPLVFKMALPAVAAQFVNLLYNIVDRIYIGHIPEIGTNALAGIGVTTSIVILISSFSAIVGAGGSPLAAIALGQGDRERAGKIVGNGFILLILFTIFTSLITYTFMEPILLFTGASKYTLGYAVDYLSIYLLGTLFVEISTGLNAFINAQGRPSIAMCSVLIGALLNIVLDPIFIFWLDMGVKGAALATILSQACSAIWVLSFLFSRRASLPLERRYMRLDRRIVLSMFALGISPFIMASTESLVGFVLNSSLKNFGDIYVSALAILQSAMQFASVPLTGFAQGFVPIISYNYGSENHDKIREITRYSFITIAISSVLILTVSLVFGKQIIHLFVGNGNVFTLTWDGLKLFSPVFLFIGLNVFLSGYFTALGKGFISALISSMRSLILVAVFILILPKLIGVAGIWRTMPLAEAVTIFMAVYLYRTYGKSFMQENSRATS